MVVAAIGATLFVCKCAVRRSLSTGNASRVRAMKRLLKATAGTFIRAANATLGLFGTLKVPSSPPLQTQLLLSPRVVSRSRHTSEPVRSKGRRRSIRTRIAVPFKERPAELAGSPWLTRLRQQGPNGLRAIRSST